MSRGYVTACQREGHAYVHTSQGDTSRRCVYCGRFRWPWSREQTAPPATVTVLTRTARTDRAAA